MGVLPLEIFMSMKNKTINIFSKSYPSLTLLVFDGCIEIINKEGSSIYSDKIFIKISNIINGSYNHDKNFIFKISIFEFRQLSYALKELLKYGESEYKKTNEKQGLNLKKTISLNYNKTKYIINFTVNGKNIGVYLNKYELLSLSDEIKDLCDFLNKSILTLQLKNNTSSQ